MKITVQGVPATQHMINAMADRGTNVAPILRSQEVQRALEGSATRRMEAYPFKPVTLAWRRRKAEEGLSPRTMHASERLAQALEHTTSDVKLDASATTLTWGIQKNSDLWMRTHIQATRGRRAVVIDATAEQNIATAIGTYVAFGFGRRALGGVFA